MTQRRRRSLAVLVVLAGAATATACDGTLGMPPAPPPTPPPEVAWLEVTPVEPISVNCAHRRAVVPASLTVSRSFAPPSEANARTQPLSSFPSFVEYSLTGREIRAVLLFHTLISDGSTSEELGAGFQLADITFSLQQPPEIGGSLVMYTSDRKSSNRPDELEARDGNLFWSVRGQSYATYYMMLSSADDDPTNDPALEEDCRDNVARCTCVFEGPRVDVQLTGTQPL